MEENKTSWPVGFLPIDLEENQRSKNSASTDRIFWKKMNDFLRRMLFAKIILKSDTTRERLTRFELRCPPGFRWFVKRIKKQSHQLFFKLYGIILYLLYQFFWFFCFLFSPPTRHDNPSQGRKRTGGIIFVLCRPLETREKKTKTQNELASSFCVFVFCCH